MARSNCQQFSKAFHEEERLTANSGIRTRNWLVDDRFPYFPLPKMETFRIDHWQLNQVALMKQGCMMTPSGWRMNAENCLLNSRVLLLLLAVSAYNWWWSLILDVCLSIQWFNSCGWHPSSSLFNDYPILCEIERLKRTVCLCALPSRKGVNTGVQKNYIKQDFILNATA